MAGFLRNFLIILFILNTVFNMKKQFVKFFLPVMVLFMLGSISRIDAQDLSKPIPIDKNLTIGKLSNGLTYYIMPNSKPENKVELRLVINAGSILEDDSQQGLAHFMEHMNFNGTKNFEKNQ